MEDDRLDETQTPADELEEVLLPSPPPGRVSAQLVQPGDEDWLAEAKLPEPPPGRSDQQQQQQQQ